MLSKTIQIINLSSCIKKFAFRSNKIRLPYPRMSFICFLLPKSFFTFANEKQSNASEAQKQIADVYKEKGFCSTYQSILNQNLIKLSNNFQYDQFFNVLEKHNKRILNFHGETSTQYRQCLIAAAVQANIRREYEKLINILLQIERIQHKIKEKGKENQIVKFEQERNIEQILGYSYYLTNNYEEAKKWYNKYFEKPIQNQQQHLQYEIYARHSLLDIYSKQKDVENVLQHTRRLIQIIQTQNISHISPNKIAQVTIQCCLFECIFGNKEKARILVQIIQPFLNKNKEIADQHYQYLVTLYKKLKMNDKAKTLLQKLIKSKQKSLKIDKDYQQSLVHLFLIYKQENNFEKLIELTDKLYHYTENYNNAQYQYLAMNRISKGSILYSIQKYNQAFILFKNQLQRFEQFQADKKGYQLEIYYSNMIILKQTMEILQDQISKQNYEEILAHCQKYELFLEPRDKLKEPVKNVEEVLEIVKQICHKNLNKDQ